MPRDSTCDRRRRFGRRLRALRLRKELSQEELARLCGISQKYLSELERGAKAPSFDTLGRLARDGLGVRLDALLYSVDEDAGGKARHLDELLAGRPKAVQEKILEAIALLLDAGEMPS